MSLALRRLSAGIAGLLVAGGAALSSGAAAHATATPPWEPDGNSVGGLLFYDASGNVVTGGNVNDPISAYVQGTHTIRGGDNVATLYGYLPKPSIPPAPGSWQGEPIVGPSTYPNAAAPAAVATSLPSVTSNGNDLTIADLVSDFPNTDSSTDGYAGLYELRLETTKSGSPTNTTYDSADIAITGTGASATWSVVYTSSMVATTTSLTVSPAKTAYHGAAVKLTATVSPKAATGSIQFRDGTKVLKTTAVVTGSASFTTKSLGNGTDKLSAKFVPAGAGYAPSTSSTHSLVVKAHPTKTSLKASAASVKKGKKLTLTATESPTASGKVTFYDGSKKLGSVKVSKGNAIFSTSKLAAGKHSLKAKFAPSSKTDFGASSSKVVKITVKK